MARTQGAIRFGSWELRPKDRLNWELYRYRASDRGFGDGTQRWASEGRYYSYNTLPLAIRYAADVEMREGLGGDVMELDAFLHEWERVVREMTTAVAVALGGGAR